MFPVNFPIIQHLEIIRWLHGTNIYSTTEVDVSDFIFHGDGSDDEGEKERLHGIHGFLLEWSGNQTTQGFWKSYLVQSCSILEFGMVMLLFSMVACFYVGFSQRTISAAVWNGSRPSNEECGTERSAAGCAGCECGIEVCWRHGHGHKPRRATSLRTRLSSLTLKSKPMTLDFRCIFKAKPFVPFDFQSRSLDLRRFLVEFQTSNLIFWLSFF